MNRRFIISGKVKVALFCFKQLPLNIEQKFEFVYYSKKNKKQLSVVVGAVRFSADNPSNFYDTTFSVSPSLIKV